MGKSKNQVHRTTSPHEMKPLTPQPGHLISPAPQSQAHLAFYLERPQEVDRVRAITHEARAQLLYT